MRQSNISTKQILAKLRRKPGKTAAELGTSVPRLRYLEKKGLVREQSERRRTPDRGRPAVQWEVA